MLKTVCPKISTARQIQRTKIAVSFKVFFETDGIEDKSVFDFCV